MSLRPLHLTPDGRLDAAIAFQDPRLVRVLGLLNRDGEEARVVGGAVRNALLGLPPGDIDIATTLLPEAVVARAKAAKIRAIPTGIAHGTVTLMSGGLPLEVTTLREDVETDGRHAVVRFGRDFARDAERRDFTVNALSVDVDGRIHDTTGGIADLAAGRIRFIGDAATRIREDYLRILRFFRFHATYGTGPLDAAGLAAAIANREGIGRLSRERVRSETLKLLTAPRAAAVVAEMDRAGLLSPVLGGTADVPRLQRLVAFDPDADAILRLMALAVRGRADIERLRDGLRLSNTERARLLAALGALGSASGTDQPPDEMGIRGLLFQHGPAATRDALRLAAVAGTDDAGWAATIATLASIPVPDFPFAGDDMMARGLKGPAIGAALAHLRRSYAEAGFPTDAARRVALLDESVAAVQAAASAG